MASPFVLLGSLPAICLAKTDHEAFYQRASACAAVMESHSSVIVQRSRTGEAGARADLLKLWTSGGAFVGTAQKYGLREAEGKQMLDAAHAAQRDIPQIERDELLAGCRSEGEKLYRRANFLERQGLDFMAIKKVNKLLGPESRR